MTESRRLIVESRETNKRLVDKQIQSHYIGQALLKSLLAQYSDREKFRLYWSVDTSWGR